MNDVFRDLKRYPYWWEAVPRPEETLVPLPRQVDALIVGGGFSGLCAARVLAKAGKSVLVCEGNFTGFGASTRNGGMLGPSFHRLGVKGLNARYGVERTNAILKQSIDFVDFVRDLTESEGIHCDFRQSGRFRCAATASHYDELEREVEIQVKTTGIEAEMLPKSRVREEIGSDRFHGGVRYPIDGGLHPAKYHDGLLRVVTGAGAVFAPQTAVVGIEPTADRFRVNTKRGNVVARQVAICTNGYTGDALPWFRRRLLPIRSAMIATEPLDPAIMDKLMPTRRMYGDSRRVFAYYRPSPDGERILFGGRAAGPGDRPDKNAHDLRKMLLDVFPELHDTRITHSWSGFVAYTFDHTPHLGNHDGLYYAMGYCGSGVARASFFGTKLAHKMLGNEDEGKTAFDDLPFETKFLYTGRPWFLPALVRWHRFVDKLGL
ncbi:MAG: FAD-binding oxidoreductase [Woeseiaceae bacterium]|nr:FAD-binding oxidoreductase [Woeseiaceae bacterium]